MEACAEWEKSAVEIGFKAGFDRDGITLAAHVVRDIWEPGLRLYAILKDRGYVM